MIALMIIYGLVFPFVRATTRIVLMLGLMFAFGAFVVTGMYGYLFGFPLFIVIITPFSELLGYLGMGDR